MKNEYILLAVTLSLTGAAVYLLSRATPISADSLVGFGVVLMLLALVAAEYRISWRKLIGR